MQINKLDIKGFGKLKDLKLDLFEGLNILYGANESGKSTVLAFICAMLYGLRGGRKLKNEVSTPQKRFVPWMAESFSGFMEYTLGSGERFRVERDFIKNTAKIYDGDFNDITGMFPAARDRGPLFAEKQLGVNEQCFLRTVCIAQMETRFEQDGNRELANRLINLNETGFEDISLKKAKDAIQKAITNDIGTERTLTKPLNIIEQRLDELHALKNEILGKRKEVTETERELKVLKSDMERLEKRKKILELFKRAAALKKEIDDRERAKEELSGLSSRIRALKLKLQNDLERASVLEAEKEALGRFERFMSVDMESLSGKLTELAVLEKQLPSLELDCRKKEEEVKGWQEKINRTAPSGISFDEAERRLFKLYYETEEADLLNSTGTGFQSRTERAKVRREKLFKRAGYLFFALSAVSGAVWLSGILKTMPFTILFLFLSVLMIALSRFYRGRLALGRKGDVSAGESRDRKRAEIDEILKMAGASSIEHFMGIKKEYDLANSALSVARESLNKAKENVLELEGKISKVKEYVLSCIGMDEEELAGRDLVGYLAPVREGVEKLRQIKIEASLVERSIEDNKENIAHAMERAALFSAFEIKDPEDIDKGLKEIEEGTEKLRKVFKDYKNKIKENLYGLENDTFKFDALMDGLMKMKEDEVEKLLRDKEEEIRSLFEEKRLKIREYETILRAAPDNDDIQRIEEEIEEQKDRRKKLKDLKYSLEIALKVLGEAGDEMKKNFTPKLNKRMSEIIKKFSRDRYFDVRADQTLLLNVMEPDTDKVVNILSLSGGTIDQMYLALRIAAVELMETENEKLPLIMDEVFAQYDDFRTEEAMKFLKELSEERQIILFTCKKREVEMAERVFERKLNLINL